MRKCAFTLVELLAVIAIISVLAACLLPSLGDALEQSRRIACANNERQTYLAAGCYGLDSNDWLPYRQDIGYINDNHTSAFYNTPLTEPTRQFLDKYMGIPTALWLAFPNRNNAMYCPSMKTPHTPMMNTDWPNNPGYSFRGFGMYSNTMCMGQSLGSTRFSIIGQSGPLGPKVFLMEHIWVAGAVYDPVDGYAGNNHNWQGGNVTAGDGSVKWLDSSAYVTANEGAPKNYYCQVYELFPAADNGSGRYGQCTISYPPIGKSYGLNHQPEYWMPNRRLFGYR